MVHLGCHNEVIGHKHQNERAIAQRFELSSSRGEPFPPLRRIRRSPLVIRLRQLKQILTLLDLFGIVCEVPGLTENMNGENRGWNQDQQDRWQLNRQRAWQQLSWLDKAITVPKVG